VPHRRLADCVLIALPGSEDVRLLTGAAATAWLLLERTVTARSLVAALARAYATPAKEIRPEVERLIAALIKDGALEEEVRRG